MFLNKIEVENFKSLKNISIKPSKITVLIGPNSGGKSSILHAISLIKQSINNHNSRGAFTTNGDIIDLGKFYDVVWNHEENKKIRMHIRGTEVPYEEFLENGKNQMKFKN